MQPPPRSELVEFLRQTNVCCRSNSTLPQVPAYARNRLTQACDNIEFFLKHQDYQRAFREARIAVSVNSAVARYVQASAEAQNSLRDELSEL